MEESHDLLKEVPGLQIRYTTFDDGKYLREWLSDPSVVGAFPMNDGAEIDDAVARWIAFARYHCSLTATIEGVPCGLVTLFLQPYKKLAHQCEFGIVVADAHRNKGIGSHLINSLMHLAKEKFRIELLHLQVFFGNPAVRLYEKMGFKQFGAQSHWIKEETSDGSARYIGRLFMERFL